jgi:predicted MFS family arabinose efflux permease
MLTKLIAPYQGLSKEVWLLALVTLINRAGAMVIPFLSLYLTKHLGFSLSQVGWVMTFFGIGSVIGVYFGGKLTDILGYFKVMYTSLILTGIAFLTLQFVSSFYAICVGVLLLTIVADSFRPAVWVALSDYSKIENRIRSVTLIRLAINLGFSVGPAVGGLIIAHISYNGIFWVDGITCIIAAILLLKYLYQKSPVDTSDEEKARLKLSPLRDGHFMIFWFAMFLIGFTFVQYFSTIPLFYSRNMQLDEQHIGLLLALNGFLIFLTEMPIVHAFEKSIINRLSIVIGGTFLLALSFVVLNMSVWVGVAVLGMVLMTFGELFGFPFSNSFALERANKGNKGAYMAMYSMTFSFAHILGPNIGMQLTDNFGFQVTWYVMAFLLLISCALLFWLRKLVKE